MPTVMKNLLAKCSFCNAIKILIHQMVLPYNREILSNIEMCDEVVNFFKMDASASSSSRLYSKHGGCHLLSFATVLICQTCLTPIVWEMKVQSAVDCSYL